MNLIRIELIEFLEVGVVYAWPVILNVVEVVEVGVLFVVVQVVSIPKVLYSFL
jgi:hypothetical protein